MIYNEDEPMDLGVSPSPQFIQFEVCWIHHIIPGWGQKMRKNAYPLTSLNTAAMKKPCQAVPGNLCALLQPRACRDLSTWKSPSERQRRSVHCLTQSHLKDLTGHLYKIECA